MTVEHLKKRVQERMDWREQDKIKQERLQARQKEIDEAPDTKFTDFWCDDCELYVTAEGRKSIANDWNNGVYIAFYIGNCPLDHRVTRRITDTIHDPYFKHFKRTRSEEADILQPDDYGFKTLYGNQLDT